MNDLGYTSITEIYMTRDYLSAADSSGLSSFSSHAHVRKNI